MLYAFSARKPSYFITNLSFSPKHPPFQAFSKQLLINTKRHQIYSIKNYPPFYNHYLNIMRDLDNSLGFNFSRFSSNGWHNFALDDASQDISLMNKQLSNNHLQIQFANMLNEPPQPAASIYGCLDSQQSENGSIKEVQYVPAQPQAKSVNSKQYFRMMKRRIKKVMSKFAQNQNIDMNEVVTELSKQKQDKKKYLYESRHRHAVVRPRGKDGKFLATRPQSERFREKKKRGRKPKNQQVDLSGEKSKSNQETKGGLILDSLEQMKFEKQILDFGVKN